MFKPEKKNNYEEFLRKKKKFAKKVKAGKKFKDTDRDGLSDYEEKYLYGTDPKNPDTDHDGMNDGAEVKRGRNPLGPGRLKDLFIPHSGNNYLPHALKPKRLLFHAVSVVTIKAITVIFVLFYPMSAWLSPDLALAQAKKIIELTLAKSNLVTKEHIAVSDRDRFKKYFIYVGIGFFVIFFHIFLIIIPFPFLTVKGAVSASCWYCAID